MDDIAIARAIHVVAVIGWIGGVYLVTMVILPAVSAMARGEDKLQTFEAIEGRFSFQAKFLTLTVGLSGFYMTYALDAWDRFADPTYWWMHAMTAIWAVFTLVLFVLEPLVLHKWFHRRAQEEPDATFALVLGLHRVLLTLSVVTAAGAVWGVHAG